MRTSLAVLSFLLAVGQPALARISAECQDAARPATSITKPTTIQLAILLDTSGSMDGLIEQAKSQLWTIVNQFATSKHDGQRPKLEVALYHYGNDSLAANEQYVQMLLPLTSDLDAVSEKLFSLKTNGGSEYCGAAIDKATRELNWSTNANDLKIIVIAGNEPFTQGDIDYHSTVPAAVKKNITINTIFCGNAQEGENTNWKDGATLGEGAYANIDQNQSAPTINTPHDAELSSLGTQLNTTYLAFGRRAEEGKTRQSMQDSSAAGIAPATAAERSVSKASGLYKNSAWDLVDALDEKTVELKDVPKDDLPKEMQSMTMPEREAHVKKLAAQRTDLQTKIADLETKRQAFIAQERAKQAGTASASTLGEALLKSLRDQATKKGYTFDATK
jgi:hypothetical protein